MDDAAILIENRSTSTWENALFAANLEHGGESVQGWRVLVATDGYHTWRCQRLFARYFKSAHSVGSQPGSRARFRGALREVFSIMKMFLRRTPCSWETLREQGPDATSDSGTDPVASRGLPNPGWR